MKSYIHTPTNNLQKSLDFYRKLQFEVISESSPTLVTDGKALIEINPDRYARAGVKMYSDTWSDVIQEAEKLTAVSVIEKGHLLSDPSGVWIYLIDGKPPHIFLPAETSFSGLGNYAGISLETTDFSRSLAFWKLLGFTNITGSAEQGWVSCTNEDMVSVSIMKPNACPHLFFNPSLTYFNGSKNLEIIDHIRELDIPITEEIASFNKEGIVDNIVIRDPGGYGFFLFSD